MSNNAQPKTLYGLPEQVIFCKRCTMSNQRPCSIPEFKHLPDRRGARYLHIDEEGICDACRYAEKKVNINWEMRENELHQLLDKHRRADGGYDCIVPGSGGKDSAYAAHLLKYKYGMHPLTITWPPVIYTDYGYANYLKWIEVGGFDNIMYRPNGRVYKQLTALAIRNLLHPFQTFIMGQYNLAPKIAIQYKIPLIFYGEAPAEYGNPIAETNTSLRDKAYHALHNLNDAYIGGVAIPELMERYQLSLNDLMVFLPPQLRELDGADIQVHYLGYYLKWTPQEAYYYAVEHTGFQARPFRTQGTYSKYASIDDKIDDFHFYTTYAKFGLGRASYDAAQEIRNKHITREEGVALVNKYDGEFPERYYNDVLDYLEISSDEFVNLCDKARSPHLWEKVNGRWELKHKIT